MADWFFDPGAAGTASGSSATDAFVNANSWFALQNSASGLAFGDRVWFRRTSQTSMVPSSALWGKSGWAATDKIGWLVGWPKSGEPFYDARPGDARSAGWDADVNTYVNTDINMAVWAHSGDPHPSAPVAGFGMANVCTKAIGGTLTLRSNSNFMVPKRNVHILNSGGGPMHNFDNLFITTSLHIVFSSPLSGGRLTLTTSTVVNTAMIQEGVVFTINELITNTNSYRSLYGLALNGATTPRRSEINVWSGNKPNESEVYVAGNRWNSVMAIVYDFFGEGPKSFSGAGWIPTNYVPTSATAQVNSQVPVSAVECVAQGGTNYLPSASRFYGEPFTVNADARALVSVTSGTPIYVRWPILSIGSMVIDPAITGAPIEMIVHSPYGRSLQSNSLGAGAITSWSGNSVSAGSAWIATFNWTPVATGSHYIDLMISRKVGFSGITYVGNPLVNSA